MKKKILVVLPGFAVGGAENMVYELCHYMDRSIFDVWIICYGGRYGTFLEEKAEAENHVVYLDCSGKVTFAKCFKVFKAFSKINPDIIHAHMGGVVYAALWTLLNRKPLVVTAHTTPQKAFSHSIEKIIYLRMKLRKFCLIMVSKENYKLACSYYKNPKFISYINNGVDLNRFYKSEHQAFTFLNVARHDENKNQKAIIEAFSRIRKIYPNIRLILVGDGPTHNLLQKQCVDAKISDAVTFTGNISEVEKYYAEADVYVQASHREAMPLSILEALAAKLPIVATNVGGVKDVVQNNGYLVPDHDNEALYIAMKKMKELSFSELGKMGIVSQSIVSKYSAENMSHNYMHLYQELIEE